MKYNCGNDVMEGDIAEREEDSLSLTVGNWYRAYIPNMSYGNIGVEEIGGTTTYSPATYSPSYFNLIKRKEKAMLQRDKEYDVKLTGEALVWLKFVSDRSCSDLAFGVNSAVCTVIGKFSNEIRKSPRSLTNGIGWDVDYKPFVASWLDEVFKGPETEDQRKLRELKEQYESLGKAIDAMEKK